MKIRVVFRIPKDTRKTPTNAQNPIFGWLNG